MSTLSEDDVNLRDLSAEELDAAWDLWFDLAQATNDADPPYSHGVFVNVVASSRPDPPDRNAPLKSQRRLSISAAVARLPDESRK